MSDDDMFESELADDEIDSDIDDQALDDDDDDQALDDDDDDLLNGASTSADMKKRKSLEARRRIENFMELRRLREIDESIGLEDLEW